MPQPSQLGTPYSPCLKRIKVFALIQVLVIILARSPHYTPSCRVILFAGYSHLWSVDIPAYFNSGHCIEVLVKSSILGSGMKIDETKTRIWTAVEVISNTVAVEETITVDEGTIILCHVKCSRDINFVTSLYFSSYQHSDTIGVYLGFILHF